MRIDQLQLTSLRKRQRPNASEARHARHDHPGMLHLAEPDASPDRVAASSASQRHDVLAEHGLRVQTNGDQRHTGEHVQHVLRVEPRPCLACDARSQQRHYEVLAVRPPRRKEMHYCVGVLLGGKMVERSAVNGGHPRHCAKGHA